MSEKNKFNLSIACSRLVVGGKSIVEIDENGNYCFDGKFGTTEIVALNVCKKEVLDHFDDVELLEYVDEDEIHRYYRTHVAHKY